mgnify:FL=1
MESDYAATCLLIPGVCRGRLQFLHQMRCPKDAVMQPLHALVCVPPMYQLVFLFTLNLVWHAHHF